jgi:cytochrome P450
VRKGKSLLSPIFSDLIRRNDCGEWSPTGSLDDSNVLCWLVETAKGKDRNPETLAHVEILLALASVHTTLLRMVNVLYDITSDPGCYAELQSEIDNMSDDWNINSYANLEKLDSVLRESQRMSPPTTLGMKRLFKQPFTFSNGVHVKKGTYVCLPIYAIENDTMHTVNPERFDGLRNYRLRQYAEENKKQEHAFSSPSRTSLNFGYGKTACPGRFFASLVIKMVFVRILPEYEFRFLPTKSRPHNIMVHEFLFCWPWQKMLVRKRQITN